LATTSLLFLSPCSVFADSLFFDFDLANHFGLGKSLLGEVLVLVVVIMELA
jgi:hypothetical protein